MTPKRVLFICTHNSARSQIAEAWMKHLGGAAFEVESAGLQPGTLKPLVIEAMREVGIDLSSKSTQTIADVLKSERPFDYVVTFYDQKKAGQCPTFLGEIARRHWDIPERLKAPVPQEEQLAHVRSVRELIKQRVEAWLAENS
ncbi:MAG: arsenate reductase ArsC [Verrucomicrobiae bacterium]|nr:arsenate reductase ArsC [Verrucomicrobiae bacterium]